MDFSEKDLKTIVDGVKNQIDDVVEAKLAAFRGEAFAKTIREIVDQFHVEKAMWGYDRTGLTDELKTAFAQCVKAAAFPGKVKSNEELISEVDDRGGVLIPTEVAASIVRVARTVGLAMSQVGKWPMKSDSLTIPAYTGSVLEFSFLGVNAAGSITAVAFEHANLEVKKAQLAFALGNDLLEDASVALGDWLVALAAEALANTVDKQVFNGTGNPFVGVLNNADVTAVTLASGQDTFQEYNIIDDSSTVIGTLEESLLDGAAFIFSKTVWANLRTQKDDAGSYLIDPRSNPIVSVDPKSVSGPRPVGMILDYPVYTNRHLPALSASAASTKFGIFGNLKAAIAYGEKGNMTVEQFKSGTFGSKEIALADQTGMVMKKRFGLTTTLPEAVVTIKTHS